MRKRLFIYMALISLGPLCLLAVYVRVTGSGGLIYALAPLVGALCVVLARSIMRRMTKPLESIEGRLRMLSGGEYSPTADATPGDEAAAIISGIDEVARILQRSFSELRDEKRKLDYVMGNISDGLFVLGADNNIAFINPSAARIFGVTAEITGKNLNYLTSETALVDTVRDCVSFEEDALREFTIGGKVFLTAVKRIPNTGLTLVVMSDVTASRENAKRREEFFANASHELKTPLTAIKGFNEMTALVSKDAGIAKYVECISRETDRMLALIDDMLSLSGLETPRELCPVPVSLLKAACEVRDTLAPAILEKNLSLEIVGDGVVEAEPEHVYELVKNIVENAVRYGRQGGSVNVAMERDGESARLCVFDDGIGISPEEQQRIFERFYRVEKSRSQKGGGTGLGLSIVKHICELYGWRVSLKSRLGVGTEVTVEF